MKVLWFIGGVFYFGVFAYDIEVDRDFWTWCWLLNSILCFIGFIKEK